MVRGGGRIGYLPGQSLRWGAPCHWIDPRCAGAAPPLLVLGEGVEPSCKAGLSRPRMPFRHPSQSKIESLTASGLAPPPDPSIPDAIRSLRTISRHHVGP